MIRNFIFLFLFLLGVTSFAQNPSTVITVPAKTITIPCGTSCTSLKATIPHIKQSDAYTVSNIPYQPFAYDGGGTELSALYTDDIYSSAISLPFPFCFYGTSYSSLVVGSNGLVSFDMTNAGKRNNFRQTVSFANITPVLLPYAGGTQNSLASTYYPKAAIMGVYHDIFPFDNGTRKIEWRVEGTAPKRRFIASYKDVPMFSCITLSATHQLIAYESTGIIEVYIKDKPVCDAWNQGFAILGIQNFERNKAAFPPGKNTGKWGTMGMNEAYRFTPSAGVSKFKKAELLSNGLVVAVADTMSGPNGDLELSFADICPAADSTQYTIQVTYTTCTGVAGEVSFTDTVHVKKERLEVSLQTQDPTCTTGGSITVTASGTSAALQYSLNGGPQQASPRFTNVPAGEHTITVSGSNGCSKTARATLSLQDDLLLVAQPTAVICAGESFTPQILSNASSFSWSPSAGISNSAESHPSIKATNNTVYTISATKGICRKTATLSVTVNPLPTVEAGTDQTIIQGDPVTLSARASAGTYQWTPATGLSSATVLNPSAMPVSTTTYRLQASANGCTASDEVTITVVSYCVKPMEAFTPNGDGINDLWLVTTGACLRKAKVEVFNRYGAKVFHQEDYKNNWNGQYEGKPLADGTYYYIISYQLINGKMVYMKGNVTILR